MNVRRVSPGRPQACGCGVSRQEGRLALAIPKLERDPVELVSIT
jgi:hypothetical protein